MVLDDTIRAVAAAGRKGDELFVAWGATVDGATARFTQAIVPEQRCVHTVDGMLVLIDDEALFELNRSLHASGEVLAGQAHAHPKRAYHSPADNKLAITPFAGGISLVIPDFARAGRAGLSDWRWYRRGADRTWCRLDPRQVAVE